MFEIPILGEVPTAVYQGGDSPVFEHLARSMATNGFLEAPDLRIGGGGLRCLVEKPFRRWWAARGLPGYLPYLPLQYIVIAGNEWGSCPPSGANKAWLVLCNHAAPQRCYLMSKVAPLAERSPEFAQHALAVLYAGLDALCHTVRPPELLAFARAYWWRGGEDKAERTHAVMSRRRFDNRVAPIAQAPHIWPPIVYHFIRGHERLSKAVQDVHARSQGPAILRPNAEALTGEPPCLLGAILRWRHGDPAPQLLAHHWQEIGDRHGGAHFHGAWPIPTERGAFEALLVRVEATVRLMEAVNHLLGLLTIPVGRSHYFGY